MYRYPDGTFKINAPNKVEFEGFIRSFADLTLTQRDELGYNEAVPIKREPYTVYETEWVKGDDLIYRETAISAVVDEAAREAAEAENTRQNIRDSMTALDLNAVRPLRAIAAGTSTQDDHDKLAEIESQVVALRVELVALGGEA